MTDTTTFPALPQGHKRFTVEQLLIEAGAMIGLRPTALTTLLHMMKQTAPDAWTSTASEPIYFAPQDVTAAHLGKTRRALYNTECQLERLGLIERRLKANGHRSPYGGCGIVFSRLIERVPELLDLVERLREERKTRRALRNRRSMFRRLVLKYIREAGSEPLPAIEAASMAILQWPDARKLEALDLDALEQHVLEAKALCEDLESTIEAHRDSSTEAEVFGTPHLQKNNHDSNSVLCNASIEQSPISLTEHPDNPPTPRDGSDGNREDKCGVASGARKSQFIERLCARRLFALAGPDMQTLIRQSQGESPTLRELHVVDAAVRILPMLGINWSAWEDAVLVMGEPAATMAVLVLDANRDHPQRAIRNPGGALRAMTLRHREGRLNLIGSLMGLARRRNM